MTVINKGRFIFVGLCLVMITFMVHAYYLRSLPMVKVRWPKPTEVVAVQVRVRKQLIFEAVYEQDLWLVVGDSAAFNIPTPPMENFLTQATQANEAVLVQKNGAYEARHLYGLDENNAHHLRLVQANGGEFGIVLGALSADGGSLFMWHDEAVYSLRFASFYWLLNTLIADVIEKRIA